MNIDNIRSIALFGNPGWVEGLPESDTSNPLVLARGIFYSIRERFHEADREIAGITRDPNLSERGKRNRKTEIAETLLAKLGSFDAPTKQIRKRRDEIIVGLNDIPAADDFTSALRGFELRQALPRDALEVEMIYRDAAQRGNWELTTAIENIPDFAAHKPQQEVISNVQQNRIRAINPSEAEKLENLEQALLDIESAKAAATSEIVKVADTGIEFDDNLSQVLADAESEPAE